jgi:predicted PurR-regulated permease PerM
MKLTGGRGKAGKVGVARSHTPIPVSPRLAMVLGVVGVVLLVLLLYAAPTIPVVALGGLGLAIALSFPVRGLSRFMPRPLAILVTFLALIGLVALGLFFLLPVLAEQTRRLLAETPGIANDINSYVRDLIKPLEERNLLPVPPEEIMAGLFQDLIGRVRELAENLLSRLVGLLSRAFGFGVTLFGVLFVAVYLLADVRKIEAAYLKMAPRRYRRDARELWRAFGERLSRYLGGLAFVIFIQGFLTALALSALGVPYAILLGVWVSVTAIIPYVGSIIGGIPAVIVALIFESPTVAVLTVIFYILIQQFEGNFLTPRIQGRALNVHPILVLFAVIGGGEIAGLAGIVFAVPTVAVARVLFDFFRTRLRVSRET